MKVKIVKQYGRPIIRPVDTDSFKLARLIKQKSFTIDDIRRISDLGHYTIEVSEKVPMEFSQLKQTIERI